jgi:hypothetical protein
MKFGDQELLEKDRIENIKQAEIKQTLALEGRTFPNKNHTLFECSIANKTVCKAEYENPEKVISYSEANKEKQKVVLGKPNFKTKGKVIIKNNHLYISALNFKNVVKILKRNYGLVGFENLKN